jgi:hypothetical protein
MVFMDTWINKWSFAVKYSQNTTGHFERNAIQCMALGLKINIAMTDN